MPPPPRGWPVKTCVILTVPASPCASHSRATEPHCTVTGPGSQPSRESRLLLQQLVHPDSSHAYCQGHLPPLQPPHTGHLPSDRNTTLSQRGGGAKPSDLECDIVVDGGPRVHAAVKCSPGTRSEDDVPIQMQGLGEPQLGRNSTIYSLQQLSSAQRLQTSVCPTRGQVPGRRALRPGPGYARFPHAEIGHGADPLSAARLSG